MLSAPNLAATALIGAAALAGMAGARLWQANAPPPFATVTITLPDGARLAVGRDEVTVALWNDCAAAGWCAFSLPADDDMQRPATGISHEDASRFISWLDARDHARWRLPTVEELRAISGERGKPEPPPLFTDPRMAWAAFYDVEPAYPRKVFPSGHFGSLDNGLRDTEGNVWEWTSSCALTGVDDERCPAYIAGGDHEAALPLFLRDAISGGCATGRQPVFLGLRLVRSASPVRPSA